VSKTGDSVSVAEKRALPLAEAFAQIAGDDRRPLLVLRECLTCTGTDDALMTRQADNEKTMLMSRWFHCVKLPPAVLEEDHPFHALFPGDDAGHLFLARANGEGRHDLSGEQSRTELWGAMEKLLKSEYKDKYGAALKKLFDVLDEYDTLDAKIAETNGRMGDAIEKDGPKSRKVKKLRGEVDELLVAKEKLRTRADEISTLALKEEKKSKTASQSGKAEKSA
jgi:hypothetical protein